MSFTQRPYAISLEAKAIMTALSDRYDAGKPAFLKSITEKPLPWTALKISLTNRCNLACTYCYDKRFQPPHETPTDMSVESVREIFRRYPNPAYVFVLGGEPFLNPEPLKEILEICPARVTVSTNGQVFNDSTLAVLESLMRRTECGRETLLQVSSEEGGQSRHRGTRNGEAILLKFAARCKKKLKIKYTMTGSDIVDIDRIASWNWDRRLPVQFDFADGGYGSGQDIDLSDSNASAVHRFTRKVLADSFDEWKRDVKADWPLRRISTLLSHVFPRAIMQLVRGYPIYSECGVLGNSIYFDPKGPLNPCHRWRNRSHGFFQDSGDIDKTLSKFHSDVAPAIFGICGSCQWRGTCGGVCPAVMHAYGIAAIAGRCKFRGAQTDAVFGFMTERNQQDDPQRVEFLKRVILRSPYRKMLGLKGENGRTG